MGDGDGDGLRRPPLFRGYLQPAECQWRPGRPEDRSPHAMKFIGWVTCDARGWIAEPFMAMCMVDQGQCFLIDTDAETVTCHAWRALDLPPDWLTAVLEDLSRAREPSRWRPAVDVSETQEVRHEW